MTKDKFKLDLSEYEVKTQDGKTIVYPLRDNYAGWLRDIPGMFANGDDVYDAINLARCLRDGVAKFCMIDDNELRLLKIVINRMLELTQAGQATVGGPIHTEAIIRVFDAKKVRGK